MTVTRGTSNGNARGSAANRRARKEWLLATFKADETLVRVTERDGYEWVAPVVVRAEYLLTYDNIVSVEELPTCRCYRCGALLHYETLTVDRIIPGCHGGTYRRNNIRPCCADCNSSTGGSTRAKKGRRVKP